MTWNEFQTLHRVEQHVFDLTCQSLKLIAQSPLKNETFRAFAFNVSAFGGHITLSLSTQAECRAEKLYPPDWDYEVIDSNLPAINTLWRTGYGNVQAAHEAQMDTFEDDDAIDAFEAGFMHSLRRAMVRLENSGGLSLVTGGAVCWTLVTQIDADTDDEERLLALVRASYSTDPALDRSDEIEKTL